MFSRSPGGRWIGTRPRSNLEADLTHAHAIEYSLRPEIGAVHAHQSRSQQASTFRGTLKYESLAGTKFDCPDVSSLPPIEG